MPEMTNFIFFFISLYQRTACYRPRPIHSTYCTDLAYWPNPFISNAVSIPRLRFMDCALRDMISFGIDHVSW